MELRYRYPRSFSVLSMVLIISSSAHAADTNIKQLEDARQQSQIATSYALNPYLRANDLKVQVDGGKATLSGKVAEDVTKNLATEIARAVTGITSVDNHIVVEPTYLPHLAPVRWGDKIDDASIAAAIRAKLRWNKDIDSVNIDVSSQRGRVNLTGRADHQAAKELAGQLAANTRGVTSVKNNLVVNSAPLSKEEREQMDEHAKMHNISDSWITAKVKSSFMYSSNINSSDINVSTNNGVVTLTGNVDSGIERAFAIKMAQNIRGVKSVNSTELKF